MWMKSYSTRKLFHIAEWCWKVFHGEHLSAVISFASGGKRGCMFVDFTLQSSISRKIWIRAENMKDLLGDLLASENTFFPTIIGTMFLFTHFRHLFLSKITAIIPKWEGDTVSGLKIPIRLWERDTEITIHARKAQPSGAWDIIFLKRVL